MKLKDFDETFAAELRDPEFAAAYLAECLSYDEPDAFLRALRAVVQANSSVSAIAKQLGGSRPALHRALSEGGNPEFRTVQSVLDAIGLQISVQAKKSIAAVSP